MDKLLAIYDSEGTDLAFDPFTLQMVMEGRYQAIVHGFDDDKSTPPHLILLDGLVGPRVEIDLALEDFRLKLTCLERDISSQLEPIIVTMTDDGLQLQLSDDQVDQVRRKKQVILITMHQGILIAAIGPISLILTDYFPKPQSLRLL